MSDGAGRSIRAKLILVISSLCGSLMVALAGAEFAVRYREGHRNTVPGGMFLYYPHERLRQALVRNSTYYRWVHINGQGFRGSRDVGAKPRDTHRIMAVGESTTFDGSVSADSLAWPARLEHWLDTIVPSCRAEVINAGVPGYRMLDNLIRLHTELLQYEPDVILLYHPHNDLSRTLHAVPWRGDPNRPG